MTTRAHSPIYMERRDPARNMARFYALELETDLFGSIVAVRRWGRIGAFGRQLSSPCPTQEAAFAEIERRAAAKRRRGYSDC